MNHVTGLADWSQHRDWFFPLQNFGKDLLCGSRRRSVRLESPTRLLVS